ncbi:MAG: phosphotransferase [Gammaproteobacteria bacterium]|jgi:aminoglycoside/choline kinase family phosphotransferase|nr:phosphotransferase [Gammaproteobacteria bacterium]
MTHSLHSTSTVDQTRLQRLTDWAASVQGDTISLQPIAGDASARRYYRVHSGQQSLVLMDAEPVDAAARDELSRFVDITARLRQAGLHAPKIHAVEHALGAMLLEDLGDRLYRDVVNQDNAESLYADIFELLRRLALDVDCSDLPDYDRDKLQQEMDLLPQWYADAWLLQPFSAAEQQNWRDSTEWLCEQALAQPQVFVHRDLHSCNLLQVELNNPGIIDYQDAVRGPISYDLISWLVDRYIQWPRLRLVNWYQQHRQRLELDIDPQQWLQWCDAMSMQRKLKVLGIFARLALRDGKQHYLQLQPGFYRHVLHTAPLYAATRPLLELLGKRPPRRIDT